MKQRARWPYIFGAVLGGLWIAGGLINEANLLSKPERLMRLNIAASAANVFLVAAGVFLVIIFLRHKKREDEGKTEPMPEPNSPEDVEYLRTRRNWIFGFVFLLEMLGSLGAWILNDYTAGLTPVNVEMIFDVLMNVVFAYLVIQLFQNRNVMTQLLYAVTIYGVGSVAINAWRGIWSSVIASVLFSAYFIYAIRAPLNRNNHRIAHLVILPLVIIIALVMGSFDTNKFNQLWQEETQIEQNFSNENSLVSNAYVAFLQKPAPALADIRAINEALDKRDKVVDEEMAKLAEIRKAYEEQLPSANQVKAIEKVDNLIALFEIHRKQGGVVRNLMEFAAGVDFENISEDEAEEINEYVKQVSDLGLEINKASENLNP